VAPGLCRAAGKRDPAHSIEAVLATDNELKNAILVMSVIARLNPADVNRDMCVRLVTLLMQMLDVPSCQVRCRNCRALCLGVGAVGSGLLYRLVCPVGRRASTRNRLSSPSPHPLHTSLSLT
jgi:hypothetical protein